MMKPASYNLVVSILKQEHDSAKRRQQAALHKCTKSLADPMKASHASCFRGDWKAKCWLTLRFLSQQNVVLHSEG